MNLNYIVVQAGGVGSRMENFTRNKPKALVSFNNLPMLFHLFKKYPDKKFVVIGDYKSEVLARYLEIFADVEYIFVKAEGKGNVGHAALCAPQPVFLQYDDGGDQRGTGQGAICGI